MRKPRFSLLLALWVATTGGALAREPQAYRPPEEMTAEEIASAKAAAKESLNPYDSGVETAVQPAPWGLLGLLGLVMLALSPFAYRAFRDTARELQGGRKR